MRRFRAHPDPLTTRIGERLMTTWRSVQPPASPAARRRPRRSGSPRQIDLFAGASPTEAPAWRELMTQMVGAFAEFERAMIRERTSAGLAQARAEGRIGGRRRKLGDKQRTEIAESVLSGRKTAAEMARIYNVSQPTVSRIVGEHRQREGD